jgi:hypothetical protein
LLRYTETNWKYEKGFDTHQYNLSVNAICSSGTTKQQQAKIEKLSLVAFLNKDQRKIFVNICRRLKRNDSDFYQNKNLHLTLFGFGPLEKKDQEPIRKKIQQFINQKRIEKLDIKFESVRPGTMYSEGKTLRPLQKISNGTVIASGQVNQNEDFFNYSNNLGLFLLNDKKTKSILGANFRRKFPSAWCTLGYYKNKTNFKIDISLERIFGQYSDLTGNDLFNISVSEISLVVSKYKNLRYPKLIQKYHL